MVSIRVKDKVRVINKVEGVGGAGGGGGGGRKDIHYRHKCFQALDYNTKQTETKLYECL